MQYKISVNNKTYTIEIEDINARPVIAHVDGQRFEVNPENQIQTNVREEAGHSSSLAVSASSRNVNIGEMVAPLPGTVIEVFMKTGDEIKTGQVVLIIEAMKMKNSIRSTRSGRVAEVLVSAGQSVAHKQELVRFE